MPQNAVRVGVPREFQESLRHYFPPDVEIVRVPEEPNAPVDVEFWIPPYMSNTVARALPFLRGVKVVQALSAGIDSIASSIPPGVVLCDGQGIHDIPVAEWVVAVILATLKYLPFYEHVRQAESWKLRFEAPKEYARLHPSEPIVFPPVLGEDLAGKNILIVGYGSIGQAIEQRLAPFGVNFTRVSRTAVPVCSPCSIWTSFCRPLTWSS